MSHRRRAHVSLLSLAAGCLLLVTSDAAIAQQRDGEFGREGPLPATSTLQGIPKAPIPAPGEPTRTFTPPKIEKRVESTELGYEKSVAPGPGRRVSFQGRHYQVAEVAVAGGGPLLFANHCVIGVRGSSLIVGLKAVDPSDDLTD